MSDVLPTHNTWLPWLHTQCYTYRHMVMKLMYIIYINSETILLRLQLFQYVNVPHQTQLTKCIVTIQNEKTQNLNTRTRYPFDMHEKIDVVSKWCQRGLCLVIVGQVFSSM